MRNESWVIVDTETAGLNFPICAVEISAQRMRGWRADGSPFRILLNHDVPIEPLAQGRHGYTREFLRRYGADPRRAHEQVHAYAGSLPMVAYNISYDWDHVLAPEYQRLGTPRTGCKAFCALTLARRTIADTPDYKLETLRQCFELKPVSTNKASQDVETLCSLFRRFIAPRLEAAGIVGFEAVSKFSRETPVTRCLERIQGSQKQARKERAPQVEPSPSFKMSEQTRWMFELSGIAKGILADSIISDRKILALQEWLSSCPFSSTPPISTVADTVERIVCDGLIAAQQLNEMRMCLETLVHSSKREAP